DNHANTYGGGIYAGPANYPVSLTDTIVAANTASNTNQGPDCSIYYLRPTSGHHNLIGQNTGTGTSGCAGFTNGTNGNLVGTAATPIDPTLGPLANNGGPTLTRALLSGSPAINNGDATDCQTTPVNNLD